jgi:UDP-N-acetylmuramoyl-tripeptide--D-alanyl-D-alanine ligase
MSALWKLDAMRAAMKADEVGAPAREITGIAIDSRTIRKNEAFFAIKGDVHDGHDFVETALKNGAGVAVVAKAQRALYADNAPLLIVDDVLAALGELAHAARKRVKGRVIAVTGSVGKTSTKEALLHVLSAQGRTHASVASFNNHWGVPLSLARCPEDSDYAVFEVGMNHAGEIAELVKFVRPEIAIITTVEPVHLEFFGSIEAIADAKAEIFSGIVKGGVVVLNRDNPQFARLAASARAQGVERIVSFGADKKSDSRLIDVALHPACSAVHADVLGQDITYKLGVPGRHMAMNSLGVLAIISLAGADLVRAALSLSQMKPASGRGGRFTLELGSGTALLIDESYNANPASMRAAMAVLGNSPVGKSASGASGRRIAVLGDMLELGATGPDLHRGLAKAAESERVDLVYCCGPLMRNLWDALPAGRRGGYADSSANLESDLIGDIRAGDAIMVKGSLGSKMKRIVDALIKKFPEHATDETSA